MKIKKNYNHYMKIKYFLLYHARHVSENNGHYVEGFP